MFDVRCSMFDPHWELDVGCSLLDVFRKFGSGCASLRNIRFAD